MQRRSPSFWLLALLFTIPLTGCINSSGGNGGKSEDKLPKTYQAAVAQLETLSKTILDACASDNPKEKADGPLHEIGHIIKAAPKLAEASGMADESLTAVQQASEELFEAFEKLHEPMHGNVADIKNLDLAALGEQVNAALDVLKSKQDLAGNEPVDIKLEGDDDHHHDHGDDDEHDEHESHDEDERGHADDHDHGEGADHDHSEDVGDDKE